MRDHINNKLAEARKRADELGVDFCVENNAFIDDEHLDCIWYGGTIGCIKYKGYVIDVAVCGDVRIIGSQSGKYPDFEYCDKGNNGAWCFSNDITDTFNSDRDFIEAINKDIVFIDNNWIDIGIFRQCEPEIEGGYNEYIDSIVADENNVLDIICDIDGLIAGIDEEIEYRAA